MKISKKKQLTMSVTLLVIICMALFITSFALAYTVFRIEYNKFETGVIDIDLNNGKPVITADEFLFEPGMTVEKPFYIQNNGTWSVYYKLYFEHVNGNLSDVLRVSILDDNGVTLLSGKLSALTESNTPVIEDALGVNESQDFTVRFHLPKEVGNTVQGGYLTFKLSAVAVQTKNNPNKEFK